MTEVVKEAASKNAALGQSTPAGLARRGAPHRRAIRAARGRGPQEALELARRYHEKGQEAWTLHLLGDITAAGTRADLESAARFYREAMRARGAAGDAPRDRALPPRARRALRRTGGAEAGAGALGSPRPLFREHGDRTLRRARASGSSHAPRDEAPSRGVSVARAPGRRPARRRAWSIPGGPRRATSGRGSGRRRKSSGGARDGSAPLPARARRAHVPHYRDLLGAASSPTTIEAGGRSRAGCPSPPRPTCARASRDGDRRDNIPRARRQPMMTSGSTGLPFEFYWDRDAVPVLGGTDCFWLGLGRDRALAHADRHREPRLFLRARHAPSLPRALTAARPRERDASLCPPIGSRRGPCARWSGAVHARGPYFIRGYPGALGELAAALQAEGVPLAERSPGCRDLRGDHSPPPMSRPSARIFGCPVVNYYSSWEVPQIAQTCPDNPDMLHVNGERVVAPRRPGRR